MPTPPAAARAPAGPAPAPALGRVAGPAAALTALLWLGGAAALAIAPRPAPLAPAPQAAVDPQAFLARLAPARRVPWVGLTREGVVAMELLARSFSLAPAAAAEAAHALCEAARQEGYDPLLFLAVIGVESSYNHLARSPVGAQGLMQLMPVTAAQLAGEARMSWRGPMAYDPVANVRLGVRYIAGLHRRFSHRLDWALTAYNRGPAATRAILAAHAGGLPARVSQFYAGPVLSRYRRLKERYGRLPW